MDKDCKYPCVMEFFEEGNGEDLAQTLLDCIWYYNVAMSHLGCPVDRHDGDNIFNLTRLLRAVLNDVHGLDLK